MQLQTQQPDWHAGGTPFMNMTLADLPHPGLRDAPNPQATGRDGGHDLNYRTLQAIGVTLPASRTM